MNVILIRLWDPVSKLVPIRRTWVYKEMKKERIHESKYRAGSPFHRPAQRAVKIQIYFNLERKEKAQTFKV